MFAVLWAAATLFHVWGPSGRAVKLRGIMVDVTGQKRAEELLRESEQRYRSVVEGSIQGIAISQGDVVRYALSITNPGPGLVTGVVIHDELPKGFSYVPGTARYDGTAIADPTGGIGPALDFPIASVLANTTHTLAYRVVVGAGAELGDGINRARAGDVNGVASNNAQAQVDFTPIVQDWLRELTMAWARTVRPVSQRLKQTVWAATIASRTLALRPGGCTS